MSVHTGAMRLMSFFTFPRRARPRSTASTTAIAWGRLKLTVALMLIPRQVACCFLPSLISKPRQAPYPTLRLLRFAGMPPVDASL
jgi:hypothetical protein